MKAWESPPRVSNCGLTIVFGLLPLFAGCGGEAHRAESRDENRRVITVHIEGFKKSQSGAI